MDKITLTYNGRRFLDARYPDSGSAKNYYSEMREKYGCSALDIRFAYANAWGCIRRAKKELKKHHG